MFTDGNLLPSAGIKKSGVINNDEGKVVTTVTRTQM